jgi:N-acetylneuraminic acid mutarotase
MLYPRESCATVFVEGYVYAIGGAPHINTAERFNTTSKTWQRISSLFHGRYESAACSALDNRFIFVFCGEPLQSAGKTIERYNIDFDHWELLSVMMPRPLTRMSVFPISNHRIAIMGGKGSHWVFVLNMESSLI